MRNWKKFLILMLSLMTIFFAGCGAEKNSDTEKTPAPEKNSSALESNNATSDKKILVAYPIGLFYLFLAWFTFAN